MLVLLLFGLMLLLMFMRVYQPVGAKSSGKVQHVFALTMQERALMQRVNIYSIGFVLLIMTVAGVLPNYTQIGIMFVAVMITAMPVRILFTSDGIGLNNVVFRPWSDFTAFRVERRRIVLVGKEGYRPLMLSIISSHQEEIIPFLRRRLPEVKAGKRTDPGKGDRGLALVRK